MPPDPLHGVTLERIVTELVDAHGFAALAREIPIRCFQHDPSIKSSLVFLRRTPWARSKVERFYLLHLREQARAARRENAADLRGAVTVAVSATQGVMGVVQRMNGAFGAVPIVSDLVYGAMRGITGMVGVGVDAAVSAVAPLLGEGVPGPEREAVLAALNGVVGDHLHATRNPLAISMQLRPPLAGLHRGGALLVLVHGSCGDDLGWRRQGHDHGRALASALELVPAYLRYNSGLHVSENGRLLSALLDAESAAFDEVVLVAHSMGGLVARSAVHAAEQAGHGWQRKLGALVTLGSPHHGAPLERGGNLFETLLGITPWSAPLQALGRIRSAGVTDLRHGNIVDADWQDTDRFAFGADGRVPVPLPVGVPCCAIAGTTSPPGTPDGARAGDNLVPIESALGIHDDPARTLRFQETHVVPGTHHVALLSSREVTEHMIAFLRERRAR